MSKIKQEKWMTYAVQIQAAIVDLFQDDSEHHIDPEELKDNENLKQFLHALMNVAPASIYNNLIGDSKNFLESNHFANDLCFEYMTTTP